jgi:DNA modification methylase
VTIEMVQSQQIPWSELPQRWGHPWHSMCSYLGTFPAALARSFIGTLSDPGDVVLDPFSGRGTTLLEARLTGRIPLASDLNPIAVALTLAKNANVTLDAALARLSALEDRYDSVLYVPEAQSEPDDIQLIFHPRVLAQLCYLRRRLVPARSEIDEFLVGVVLGAMHGNERQDGSSSYASISMPNTFSMSPEYVRRYVQTNQLQRVDRNVFQILRERCKRLFRSDVPLLTTGVVARADAKRLDCVEQFSPYRGKVRLVLTSPPYLGVVNYARQNWIRTWFLAEDPERVSDDLDDNLTLGEWLDFANATVQAMRTMLRPDGVAALVIGDVAKSSRSVIPLAREFIRRLLHDGTFAYVGCLSDHIQTDVKTTRIWKDTKGQATAVDRVVILADRPPTFRTERLGLDLFGNASVTIPPLHAADLAAYARAFAG